MGLLHYLRPEYIIKQSGYADQNYQSLINYLNEYLAEKPTDAEGHLLLAKVYLRRGTGEEAREHGREALSLGLVNPLAKQARTILE